MRTLLRIIARAITVVVGYVAACLAAGMVIVLAVAGWAGGWGEMPVATLVSHTFYAGGALAAFVVVLAFPPAAVMALIGEIFAIRSGFYYVAIGGLIGALGYVGATDFGRGGDLPAAAADELMAFLAAGLVAGAAYWMIAGRGAGLKPAESGPDGPEEPESTPEPEATTGPEATTEPEPAAQNAKADE